jgi:hypothetical protein
VINNILHLDPVSLSEQIAVVPIDCINCDTEIDIGDDCFVDTSMGIEEKQALIYCVACVDKYLDNHPDA